jgi:transposase-like protein
MAKTKRYPVEVRERTVRLVLEHREEYSSMWAAVTSIAQKFGCTAQTLQGWVRQVGCEPKQSCLCHAK